MLPTAETIWHNVSYVVLATSDDFHDFAKSSRGILDNIYLDSNRADDQTIVLTNMIQQLLGNNGFHVKGKTYDALRPFIGESLAFLTGKNWITDTILRRFVIPLNVLFL